MALRGTVVVVWLLAGGAALAAAVRRVRHHVYSQPETELRSRRSSPRSDGKGRVYEVRRSWNIRAPAAPADEAEVEVCRAKAAVAIFEAAEDDR